MSTNDINYPRFISNKPCGIDKFEGKSQERLTNAIANHLTLTDANYITLTNEDKKKSLPRIIGLEGDWGVGKSNVIKQLKDHNKVKISYYIFEFDAWGHQEDLQRRSFLETLTRSLIEEKIMDGSWEKKLNDLLAHKITRVNKSLPKFNAGAFWTALFLFLTPITVFVAERLEKAEIVNCIYFLTLIAFAPILFGLVLWFVWSRFDKNMRGFGWFLQISKNENIETENTETINEEEPNVAKFKDWMMDISDYLGGNDKIKKLIIVYDNMDRLPAEKVKELWSSIHTFFSENGFENVWAIIPFDEKHLSCAFGKSENKEELTKYFISKTFPVVYRVTPPVITDFKNIFNTLFEEAFNNTILDEQKDIINRIFRLEKPNATVREIIEFINQLVALKNIWEDEIDILFIAIFVLKKDIILSNPVEQILSGEYLDKHIQIIVPDNDILRKGISALVYGVSLKIAEQIPMTKYLDSCFNIEENKDINEIANSENFIIILCDKVKNSDIAQLDNIIQCLRNLDVSHFSGNNQNSITSLWNILAQRKMEIPLSKQDIENNHKFLIEKADDNHKKDIIKYLCEQIQSFKEFNGKDYFGALERLDDWIKRKEIDVKIIDYLSDLEKNPDVFVDYVFSAKEKYLLYKLTVNPENLVKYLCSKLDGKDYYILEVLQYIYKDTKFQIDKVKVKIEQTIKIEQFNENNAFKSFFDVYKKNFSDTDENTDTIMDNMYKLEETRILKSNPFMCLFDAYKILSSKKPLKVQLNATQRQNIWNLFSSKPETTEYLEIVTIQIANGINIGGNFTNEQIEHIAKNLVYYANYEDLLINNLTWNIPILTQALKYMTENK